ncbi:Acetyl-coenzyme A synthetase [Paraburkholderia humisilvae]|uniref:Acetyl-coenzyme A synthetase n=2 Tax=Paraburkholderia humisilvae TaxID=627669 RepID=A0A6J5E132_9BURK|nr:Acetyl-coenzyme A synthetase [Paraburkholderia humisilvae]
MQGQTSVGRTTTTRADTNANKDAMPATDVAPPTRAILHTPSPERIARSQMSTFAAALQARTGVDCSDYEAMHAFSVRDYRTFWRAFIESTAGLDYAGDPDPVCVGDVCEHATFFPNLELNFADNLLGTQLAPASAPALTACHADGRRVRLTRGELRERVARLACALERLGVKSGDRVAAVMRNDEQAIVTALSIAALGATLSTASPEMGSEALLDRFEQLSPRLLFAHTATLPSDTGMTPAEKVAKLATVIRSLDGVVTLDDGPLPAGLIQPVHSLAKLIASANAADFVWRRFPFNQPLFIMFSSGTTGKPKCIVHGAGGSLIEHLKEHRLHSDLRPGDKMYFHTSCAWMMWNWQLSALASGVEIVTYSGPLASVDTLWRLVADEQVTVFGTSPAYLKMCSEAGLEPAREFDLHALRAMMSTGAVLFDAQFEWIRDHVKPLQLQSISGGTDILGCFVLGNPNLPVFTGEAQCKSLALDVQAWDNSAGAPAQGIGELVCANPFPSRPLGFFGDPDGARFHKAYFAANPGLWTHGDLIEFSATGSARLHGRSDGVLNVRGVNVGPGEIYRVLSDIEGVREAMVVQQNVPARAAPRRAPSAQTPVEYDRRVVLLVVLQNGVALNGALIAHMRRELARRASRAHVPDVVMQVDALPVTHSGKPSEAAARNAVNGLPVGNTGALRNPECLDVIRNHPALTVTARELPPPGETAEDLERYLQALWERLFDLTPIGRDDSFFDLGGDSLLAAAMIAEVQQATGATISLATLLAAPSVAQLATHIRGSHAGEIAASQIILPLRAGTGAPVFWVHSMAGSVMECLAVIHTLRTPRPFIGIHARGLNGEAPPLQNVEQMASSYIAEMRSVQPHGPYSLVGYSFGGLVAYEIAQQLHRAGEQVEMLCLVDTYVHERCLPWGAWLRFQRGYVKRQWRTFSGLPLAQRVGFVKRKLNGAADKIRLRLGHMAHKPFPQIAHFPPVLVRVREAMRVAMTTYRPAPYMGGPVHYVRAALLDPERGDPLPLWRRVARRGLAIANVDGSHTDMILEPNIDVLAAALDRVFSNEIAPSGSQSASAALRTKSGYA